jgi:CPA2 family monovalent cation:H+ antiporter-2
VVGIAAGLIALKIAVITGVALMFKLPPTDRWLAALGLAQAGEFGFVLLTFATGNDVLAEALADRLTLSITLSMLVTPLLFIVWQRFLRPKFRRREQEVDREPDTIDEEGTAIIAGLGRFGQIVQRMLTASGFSTVVLDHSAPQIELLKKFGVKAYYGDASRPELLHAAGLEKAKVVVVTLADADKSIAIIEHVKKTRPDATVIARATDRVSNYRLCEAGADVVISAWHSARPGRADEGALPRA